MTGEFDFVLASVRRFFRPESPVPSKEGLDWTVVAELAERHAVEGFLQSAGDVQEQAGKGMEAARANLALSAELVKLAGFFDEGKIDIVPLKGPVLGAALYHEEVLKASSDLDLMVRSSDALRAKRLLESVGYRLLTVPHWPEERDCFRNVNDELAFRDPGCWLKLDLHWSLLPGYFPSPFNETELWAGVRPLRWGNARIYTLSPEQQAMFLCAHGAKHLWARLGWLCDLARLVQVEPGMDWQAVFEQTRRSSTTRMTLLGLLLADQLLGVEIPPVAAALVDADPQVKILAATVFERLRSGRPASNVATASFCVRVLEKSRQRVRLLFGMFVQPTEAEYQVLQMPSSLYWVYYLFRPLRLAAKYTRQLFGSRDRQALHAKKV